MYIDGDITMMSLRRRRQLLQQRAFNVPNLVTVSELKEISRVEDLNEMIAELLKLDLGGLFFKDRDDVYKSGKTNWFNVDRKYFYNRRAKIDLLVLGGWREIGSEDTSWIFLMGCFDSENDNFCTVVKVRADPGIQLDEDSLLKISGDIDKLPDWLRCESCMVPEYVVNDPKTQSVWTVSGIELICDSEHSANKISLLYPKLTEVQAEKNWEQADNLVTLQKRYDKQTSGLVRETELETNPLLKRKAEESSAETSGKKFKDEPAASTSSSAETETFEELKPIPQYFKDIRICLDDEMVGKHQRWINFFKECGGTLVDEEHATYILHYRDTLQEKKTRWRPDVIHIIVEWIKHAILKGSLQSHKRYEVRFPSETSAEEEAGTSGQS